MTSLLDKLESAVRQGIMSQPFSTKDLKFWIDESGVVNDRSSRPYSQSYINGFLSSSVIQSTSTKRDKRLIKVESNPFSYMFA